MAATVQRHFVTIDSRWGTRQVHYRRAGTGPLVLLLHQSPQSSREMVPLMAAWGKHFTVIAPDTPGYGQSDPLGPGGIGIADFAAALLEFANAIGARRFGVYGFHTGASIGLAFAQHHPERVTAIAANGVVVMTEAERRNILANYLPPLEPRWDGSHLAWLWARMREQTIFFPWHDRSLATRMEFDVPGPTALQASLLDFLRAGDNYATAYRAAFEFRTEQTLVDLRTAALVTAAPGDPLQAHLGRIRDVSSSVEIRPAATPAETLQLSLQHLLAHRGDPCPAPVATRPVAGQLWQQMLPSPAGQMRVRLSLDSAAEPVLMVHDIGGSADLLDEALAPCIGARPVVAVDLPGHGESDREGEPTVRASADHLAQALAALGLGPCLIAGCGFGGYVALETALRDRAARHRALLLDAPFLSIGEQQEFLEYGLPSTEPAWHGGHLLLGWHLLRDGRLFFPWFRRNRSSIRRIEPDLDNHRLQRELRDLMRASGTWQALLGDALAYPLQESLRRRREVATVAISPACPTANAARAVVAATPGLRQLTWESGNTLSLPMLLRQL
jgi:pimeloyl-ACP methyl ester carboxylesterase